ncbi:uncharacterized protein IAS62_004556 [Cryptococcus decagattii]|uniref:Uncharacterized protein n=1 Tax=Cryptococcus decagattii TaxID=1859122 RepID=A0ABZ2AYD5_9TREE
MSDTHDSPQITDHAPHTEHSNPAPTPSSHNIPPLSSQPSQEQHNVPLHHPAQHAHIGEDEAAALAMEADMDASVMIDPSLMGDEEGFDPTTLANLAALSRIINDEDEDMQVDEMVPEPEPEDEPLETGSPREPLTREQVQEFMSQLAQRDKSKDQEDKDKDHEGNKDKDQGDAGDKDDKEGDQEEEEVRSEKGEDEYEEQGKVKGKRKRNRTVLSCTECHRRKRMCWIQH